MRGVTITDSKNNFLRVDLVDILHLLGSQAQDSEWEISDVECVGFAADALHKLSDSKTRVPGQTLLQMAAHLTQVIDGEFTGYCEGEKQPWIIVRAVDSSAYDVQSEDEDVLAHIRCRFKEVTDFHS